MTKVKNQYSAGGVLIHNGQVLLIHWDPPRSSYDFPKGGIRWFESPQKACLREVLEETGYKVRIVKYIGKNSYEYDWTDGKHYNKTVKYYLVELASQEQYPTRRERYETFQNQWVDLKNAEAIITRDINKEIMRKAVEVYPE